MLCITARTLGKPCCRLITGLLVHQKGPHLLAVISLAPVVGHLYLAEGFGFVVLILHSLISVLEGFGSLPLG